MKNRFLYLIVILIAIFSFNSKVFAVTASLGVVGTDSNASSLKSSFDAGIPTLNVSGSQEVEVFGKSVCSASSGTCTHVYQGVNSDDIKDLLQVAVKCTNGETKIQYNPTPTVSVAGDYKSGSSYTETSDLTAYWNEGYQVTCTSSSTGSNIVGLESSTTSSSTSSSSSSNSTSSGSSTGSNTSSSTSNQNYSSSTTETSPETGVETYYIVLGIVAILSYIIMVVVKRYNLFKNI